MLTEIITVLEIFAVIAVSIQRFFVSRLCGVVGRLSRLGAFECDGRHGRAFFLILPQALRTPGTQT